jgi:hypothetical protein
VKKFNDERDLRVAPERNEREIRKGSVGKPGTRRGERVQLNAPDNGKGDVAKSKREESKENEFRKGIVLNKNRERW